MAAPETTAQSALRVINEQLPEAIDLPKCHKCGCLQPPDFCIPLQETEP